jgi:tetratricopeptide (TPR) repeat protein
MSVLLGWLEDARARRLAIQAGIGVVAAVLIAVGVWAWYRSAESRGEAALASATVLGELASAPQATPEARTKAIDAFEAVLRDHPRFSGAAQAAYRLGNLRYAAGAYPQARGAYELALAKGGPASLRVLSAVGIGYTWEAEKNYVNAAAAYEAALRSMPAKTFLYEDTLMALARVQELGGKPAAAVETYQRLLKEMPDTRRADDLKTRLATLKSRSAQ